MESIPSQRFIGYALGLFSHDLEERKMLEPKTTGTPSRQEEDAKTKKRRKAEKKSRRINRRK
jgi:hypothetical protein